MDGLFLQGPDPAPVPLRAHNTISDPVKTLPVHGLFSFQEKLSRYEIIDHDNPCGHNGAGRNHKGIGDERLQTGAVAVDHIDTHIHDSFIDHQADRGQDQENGELFPLAHFLFVGKDKFDAKEIIHHRRDDEPKEFGDHIVYAELVGKPDGNAKIYKKTYNAYDPKPDDLIQ